MVALSSAAPALALLWTSVASPNGQLLPDFVGRRKHRPDDPTQLRHLVLNAEAVR